MRHWLMGSHNINMNNGYFKKNYFLCTAALYVCKCVPSVLLQLWKRTFENLTTNQGEFWVWGPSDLIIFQSGISESLFITPSLWIYIRKNKFDFLNSVLLICCALLGLNKTDFLNISKVPEGMKFQVLRTSSVDVTGRGHGFFLILVFLRISSQFVLMDLKIRNEKYHQVYGIPK